MAHINLLPSNLISLIAAGEVIQRPASVVKELLENALDANARNVQIFFEDGGKTLIQVVDDGCGMDYEDAKLCIERHATSKITSKEDLFRIGSYGFRGEAMNAIATVGEMEIMTRRTEDEVGIRLMVEESKIKKEEAVVMPAGTQIIIRYLFKNLPGRRNFLKSHAIESKHIIDEFQRVALARPDIAFSLYQNSTLVYQLPASKLYLRIIHLFGKNYQKQLIPCEEEIENLAIHGYIGTPYQAKKTRGGQFFFVNNRFIRSSYLQHAVKKAFETLIPEDSFPFYVLYINVPLNQVDVNVHPNKTEVKFEEEKLLYALIATSLRKALAQHHGMHTINFDKTETQSIFDSTKLSHPNLQPIDLSKENSEEENAQSMLPIDTKHLTHHIPSLFLQNQTEKQHNTPVHTHNQPINTNIQKKNTNTPSNIQQPLQPANTPIAQISPIKLQLHQKYICTQTKSGLLIVHQHRAYERILYERNIRLLQAHEGHSQKLLFPYTLHLQPADITLLQACQSILYQLGFRFTIEKHSVVIMGHPVDFLGRNTPREHLLDELLEQYKKQVEISLPEQEKWAIALARRSNITEQATLLPEEMESIINQLFSCKNTSYTLDGKSIWRIIPIEKVDEIVNIGEF